MHNSPYMTIVHRIYYLLYDSTRFDLGNASTFFDPLVELAARCAFHDHHELLPLDERVVELNDVLMDKLLQ